MGVFNDEFNKSKVEKNGSSRCGLVVRNLTSIHENEGLIPGPTQWVKDPALP